MKVFPISKTHLIHNNLNLVRLPEVREVVSGGTNEFFFVHENFIESLSMILKN